MLDHKVLMLIREHVTENNKTKFMHIKGLKILQIYDEHTLLNIIFFEFYLSLQYLK